jgi:flavin reductase (DIM6/NTAB) family NADH-FMN oxidoreductase RutF
MEKTKFGPKTLLYPMPTTIIGANVKGKPNFLTIAWCGIIGINPAMISIALGKNHYTNPGIKENGTFSVNIPSEELVQITDYCGIASGKNKDKSGLFDVFYGELATAPMIKECPINLECRVVKIIDDINSDEIFLGEIVETYCSPDYLTDDLPDMKKVKPILYSTQDKNYWKVGDHLGKAYSIGKDYIK